MPRSAASQVCEAVAAAATDLARRRHHAAVHPAHVLSVLFETNGMARRVRRLHFDADHLRAAVERALDDLPEANVYRDATPPELGPSLEHVFARVEPQVQMWGTSILFQALQDAPELRGAFRPYVLDESVVTRLKHDVHGSDCADALTLLLTEHFDLATRLTEGGLDIEDLTTKSGIAWRDIASEAVEAAKREGEAKLEPAFLVAHLIREVAPRAGFELSVIGHALDLLLHGPMPDESVAADAPAEIVFLNDGFTRQDVVQDILADLFGMNETEAYETMLAIDARDEAVVSRLAGAPARELATLARRKARNGGHPLRVLVRQLSK